MTKTLICRTIMKNNALLMDHVFRFAFVGLLIIIERRRIDGNPRKRKCIVICTQFFSSSPPRGKRKFSRQKLTHAYYTFASFVRREGHLDEVFLALVKTRLI